MRPQRPTEFLRHRLMNVERGSHSALRVIGMGDRCAKDGHDVVAHMSVDATSVTLDNAVHGFEIAVKQRVGRLRRSVPRRLAQR